jgi:hypothetical protein
MADPSACISAKQGRISISETKGNHMGQGQQLSALNDCLFTCLIS